MSHRWGGITLLLIGLLLQVGCHGSGVARSTARFPGGTGFVKQDVVVDGGSALGA